VFRASRWERYKEWEGEVGYSKPKTAMKASFAVRAIIGELDKRCTTIARENSQYYNGSKGELRNKRRAKDVERKRAVGGTG